MRIGILGGTFNPIHNGHIIVGKDVYTKLKLDKLIYIPAYIPPHKNKDDFEITGAIHRYNMVKIAIKEHPFFAVSDIEINLAGISYTIRTIREIIKKYNLIEKPYFFAGSDYINEFDMWKDVDKILDESNFYIMRRCGYELKNIPDRANSIEVTAVNISSTDIRQRIKKALPIKSLVPVAVEDYIIKNRLYL